MPNKLSEAKIVSALAFEMRSSIRELAGPRSWTENRKRWLERASRAAGITYRQARALFYMEQPDPRGSVVEMVRAALREKKLKKARIEAADLASRYEQIAEAINAKDPDFYSEDVAALVHAARTLRGLDRA